MCFIKDVIPGTSSFSEETEQAASMLKHQLSPFESFGLVLNLAFMLVGLN